MNGVLTPEEMMATLGVKRTTYHKILRLGLLGYSRLYKGGPKVHTEEHLDRYRAYLNTLGEVSHGAEAGVQAKGSVMAMPKRHTQRISNAAAR